MKRIFISKNPDEVLSLSKFCEQHNVQLLAKSLISFEAVAFELKEDFDVVFFSSIRAANYFLQKNLPISTTVKFACMGKETEKKLKKIGISCAFVGKESGNPNKVSHDFASWLEDRKVLFPHSNLSLFSILQNLDPIQYQKIQVYQTNSLRCLIPKNDIYIFTSPSNFFSFAEENEITEKALVFAFGKSTSKAIKAKSKISVLTLKEANLFELEEEILHSLKLLNY